MTEIIGIRGAVPPGEPVPNVVRWLEDLLRRAQAGEIRAVAAAVVHADGTVGTGWEKPMEEGLVARSIENHGLASGLVTLLHRYGEASAR